MHLAAALGTPQVALFGPTNPFHWRPRSDARHDFAGRKPAPVTDFVPKQPPRSMNEISTEQVIDAMQSAAVGSGSASHMSKIPPVAKVKEPLWTTIRSGWRPYRRLYSYAMPYKWRFIVGLAFGFLFGDHQLAAAAGPGARGRRRLPRPRRHGPAADAVSIPSC